MVAIAGMRIYLDFDLDESYTPTLIRFAAGTGYNDLQEFSVMRFEQPRGWIDVEWDGVGDVDEQDEVDDPPVLRCMLVQVRICENHQNGKDTHLRGLQLFARDAPVVSVRRRRSLNPSMATGSRADSQRKTRNKWAIGGWMDTPVIR
jgi:anaphase-promoting complex subunit 10